MRIMYLFGGDRPWDESQFTASDDRVRGGKSQSYLTVPPGRPRPRPASASDTDTDKNADRRGSVSDSASDEHHPSDPTPASVSTPGPQAEFSGHLDITALGGAGFASQRTVDDITPWDVSAYDALVLDVARADGKKYTLTLKDEVLPRRPDGRDQSTVSWEYDFVVPPASDADAGASCRIVIPFGAFEPTYRGRPKPDAEPLDLSSVKRMSFMMRSFFGTQEGDFSIILNSLSVEKTSESQHASTTSVATSSTSSYGNALKSWVGNLLGWSQ